LDVGNGTPLKSGGGLETAIPDSSLHCKIASLDEANVSLVMIALQTSASFSSVHTVWSDHLAWSLVYLYFGLYKYI
jgi:hypothetical protein